MAFGALGCIPDVVEATDPKTLETKIAESFARQLDDAPVSQLIEIVLCGGGAGGIYQATIYYSTEEVDTYPPLADQNVKVVWGSDRSTVLTKLRAFYADVAVDRTTFVEKAAGGAGVLWVDVIVYTLGEAFLASLRDVDEVRASAAGWDSNIEPTPVSSEEKPAKVRRPRKVRKKKARQ